MRQRIGEVVECLRDGNHLGALGALAGVDEQVLYLSTALKLIQGFSYRNTVGLGQGKPGTPKPRSVERR